jgi:hypothetical protein
MFGAVSATADTPPPNAPAGPTFTVLEENDLFWNPIGEHTDRHYTQGLKLIYMGAPDHFTNLTACLNGALPSLGVDQPQTAFGFALGQNIYTPEDYSVTIPDPNDRPYAGWLYGELIFQRHVLADAMETAHLETFTLSLGIVGPEALGEQAQNTMHRIRDFPLAMGWDAQLKTEPTLLLKYDRRWRVPLANPDRPWVDVVPHVAGHLGNVQISAEAGAMMRVGTYLPEDFGIERIDSGTSPVGTSVRAAPRWSVYLYGEAIGRAVGHNLFLDGNSFRDGPSVDRKPLVADLAWGLAVQCGRHLAIHYGWMYRTEEFKTQRGADKLGMITVRTTF